MSQGNNGGAGGGSEERRELSLEEIIQLANRIGLEHVDKRRDAERLELLRTSLRAQLMNRIEQEHMERAQEAARAAVLAGKDEAAADKIAEKTAQVAEARLKRLAEAHPDYLDLLDRIAESRAESEKLRIRYDSYRNLFEARRTMISYKKTEMKTI